MICACCNCLLICTRSSSWCLLTNFNFAFAVWCFYFCLYFPLIFFTLVFILYLYAYFVFKRKTLKNIHFYILHSYFCICILYPLYQLNFHLKDEDKVDVPILDRSYKSNFEDKWDSPLPCP